MIHQAAVLSIAVIGELINHTELKRSAATVNISTLQDREFVHLAIAVAEFEAFRVIKFLGIAPRIGAITVVHTTLGSVFDLEVVEICVACGFQIQISTFNPI